MDEKILNDKQEKLKNDIAAVDASVKSMEDFTSPEQLYQELIASVHKYHPSADTTLIEKAYQVAHEAHQGQVRKSGEPYIIHPLCVAIILADLELDKESIAAGLLHDVVEDTVMTEQELEQEFGSEVALLVDGVTKLGQLNYSADKVEEQARRYGHSERRELAFLVAHSMLHLLGYDHMEDGEREQMEDRQRKILETRGYTR